MAGLLRVAVVSALVGLATGGVANAQYSQDGLPWRASVGTVILHRSTPDGGTIVANNPGATVPFSTGKDFEFGWNAGVDLNLARAFGEREEIEVRFFNVGDSEATHQFNTPGNFIGAGFTGPGGTNFNGRYLTNLYSTEINWRHQTFDRLDLLAGFRWIEIADEFTYKLNGNVATGHYDYSNRLYGGQLGADWSLLAPSNPLQLNVIGKAGIYTNVADGGIQEFAGNSFIGGFAGSDDVASFVGELGFMAAYPISNHIALRAGYQLLWLESVALASDNASFSLLNPSLLRRPDTDGDLFYHGALISLDFNW